MATNKKLPLSIMPMPFWLPFVRFGSNINVGSFSKRLIGGFLITDGIRWFGSFIKLNVQCVKSRQEGKLC